VSLCHSLFTHVGRTADSRHRWEHVVANPDSLHTSHSGGYRIFVLTTKILIASDWFAILSNFGATVSDEDVRSTQLQHEFDPQLHIFSETSI
jgi:hypothetical protein